MTTVMNPRERMLATFVWQPVDHFPVTAPYLFLFQTDFWERIYQLPSWTYYDWCLKPTQEHLAVYPKMDALLPFDIAQPEQAATDRADRPFQKIVQAGDGCHQVDTRTGKRQRLELNLHEEDRESEWPRIIHKESDINPKIQVLTAQQLLDSGRLDYLAVYQQAWGRERWIAGTMVNSFYNISHYVGLANRFVLILDEPELMHAISRRLTQSNIEEARAMARAGCDAIFIDDATATLEPACVALSVDLLVGYLYASGNSLGRDVGDIVIFTSHNSDLWVFHNLDRSFLSPATVGFGVNFTLY